MISKGSRIYSSFWWNPEYMFPMYLEYDFYRDEKEAIQRRFRKSCSFVLAAMFSMIFASGVTLAEERLGHHLTLVSPPVAAPLFRLQDMDERFYSLAEFKGKKVVMLNFWATWCPPCRKEMPSMEHLHQLMGNEGLQILAVNQMEDPDHVFAYTGQLAVDPTFPVIFDRNSEVSAAYRVQGLPTTFLVDKRGYIRYRAIGGREFDHPEVERIIRGLLSE